MKAKEARRISDQCRKTTNEELLAIYKLIGKVAGVGKTTIFWSTFIYYTSLDVELQYDEIETISKESYDNLKPLLIEDGYKVGDLNNNSETGSNFCISW